MLERLTTTLPKNILAALKKEAKEKNRSTSGMLAHILHKRYGKKEQSS